MGSVHGSANLAGARAGALGYPNESRCRSGRSPGSSAGIKVPESDARHRRRARASPQSKPRSCPSAHGRRQPPAVSAGPSGYRSPRTDQPASSALARRYIGASSRPVAADARRVVRGARAIRRGGSRSHRRRLYRRSCIRPADQARHMDHLAARRTRATHAHSRAQIRRVRPSA